MIRFCIFGALLALNTSTSAVVILAHETFGEFEARGLRAAGGDGTLDSDQWRITGASIGDTTFAASSNAPVFARGRSNGGVRRAGLYAFSLPQGRRGLGVAATRADFTPGALIWSVVNRTQDWINHLALAFELWVLNDGSRGTEIETAISFDNTSWVPLASTVTALVADNLGWRVEPQFIAIGTDSNASAKTNPASPLIAPNSRFWLRWRFDDAGGSGNRDEFALTSLTVLGAAAEPLPDPPVVLNAPPTQWCVTVLLIMLGVRRWTTSVDSVKRRRRSRLATLWRLQTSQQFNAADMRC